MYLNHNRSILKIRINEYKWYFIFDSCCWKLVLRWYTDKPRYSNTQFSNKFDLITLFSYPKECYSLQYRGLSVQNFRRIFLHTVPNRTVPVPYHTLLDLGMVKYECGLVRNRYGTVWNWNGKETSSGTNSLKVL